MSATSDADSCVVFARVVRGIFDVDPVEGDPVDGDRCIAPQPGPDRGGVGRAGAAGVGLRDALRVDDRDRLDLEDAAAASGNGGRRRPGCASSAGTSR